MGMRSYLVNYLQISALLFALDHFPENTPKRWQAIALYVELASCAHDDNGSELITECFTPSEEYEKVDSRTKRIKCQFQGTPAECKDLASILKSWYPHIFEHTKERYSPLLSNPDRMSPLKPMVITPTKKQCCGLTIKVRNRPSFPIVYTSTGTYIAASYHGKCIRCNKVYFPSHVEYPDNPGGSMVLNKISDMKILLISPQTGFEISYLEYVSNQLSICSATFESLAELYTINHIASDKERLTQLEMYARGSTNIMPWKLNPQRLEEGWFLFRLGVFFQTRGEHDKNLWTKTTNGRKDLELLCRQACEVFVTETSKWVTHRCLTPGCQEGFVMLDGNEKLKRAMCAAPHSKIKMPASGMSIMSCCPNTPSLGGYHIHGSKYCKDHNYLNTSDSSVRDQLPVDLSKDPENSKFKDWSSQDIVHDVDLSKEDESTVGCRKPSNVTKYYDRTAGIATLLKPCGIVLNWTEMYTSESLTQMYFFLAFTFGHGQNIQHLKYLGYDRACGLEPFLRNIAKKQVPFATVLLQHVKFLVDRFHVKGHTEKCCMPFENNPECEYHPDLERFKEIHTANTECAEQAFRWLNKLKYTVRQMSRYKFNFFLFELVNMHNTIRELTLKAEGKLAYIKM